MSHPRTVSATGAIPRGLVPSVRQFMDDPAAAGQGIAVSSIRLAGIVHLIEIKPYPIALAGRPALYSRQH